MTDLRETLIEADPEVPFFLKPQAPTQPKTTAVLTMTAMVSAHNAGKRVEVRSCTIKGCVEIQIGDGPITTVSAAALREALYRVDIDPARFLETDDNEELPF